MITAIERYVNQALKHSERWAWLSILVLVIAGGCRSDEPLVGNIEADKTGLRATFTLFADGPDRSTRAPADSETNINYIEGENYENYIGLPERDFRFFFFGEDNKYKGQLTVEEIVPVGNNPGTIRYEVNGEIDKELKNQTVKIMALANWGVYPDTLYLKGKDIVDGEARSIADVAQWGVFNYDPTHNLPSADNKIPMYGITNPIKLEFVELGTSTIFDAGQIHLLRAWVKIEVLQATKDQEIDGQTLESAKVVYYNTKGYCAPSGILTEDDYVNSESNYTILPHIPKDAEIAEQVIELIPSADGTRFIGYVPEFLNTAQDVTTAYLKVKFNQSEKEDELLFCNYDANGKAIPGEHFDLLRNNWYRYTVTKKLDLNVEVQVIPYKEVELSPEFGLGGDYPLSPIYNDVGELMYWLDPITGILYNNMWREQKVHPALLHDLSSDPITGYMIVRDDNNVFLCFSKYIGQPASGTDDNAASDESGDSSGEIGSDHNDYAFDTVTEIDCPLSNRIFWEKDGETWRYLPIRIASDKVTLYWHLEGNSVHYSPDGKHKINNPFNQALLDERIDTDKNWPAIPILKYVKYKELETDPEEVLGYFRLSDRQWVEYIETVPDGEDHWRVAASGPWPLDAKAPWETENSNQ